MPALSSRASAASDARDAGLQVAGAAAPDRAVDDRRGERVLALGARPNARASRRHGRYRYGRRTAAACRRPRPCARPRRWAGRAGIPHVPISLKPQRAHLLFEIGDEIRLVAGDALAPDRAAQQRERRVAVERGRSRAARSLALVIQRGLPQCGRDSPAAAKCGRRERRRRTAYCAIGQGRSPQRR